MLQIPYRSFRDYVTVDVAKLRPGDSYKHLLENRTHATDELVRRFGKIPEDLLIDRCCPTCGSAASAPELEKDHLQLVRCQACDLVYTNPIFDEEHYRQIYQSKEYQEIVRKLGIDSHLYRVSRFGAERVSIMQRFIPREAGTPRLLDVGCSTGFVVEAAQEAGWKAMGIDLNPSAIEFGRQRGLDLHAQALGDVAYPAETFDAISMFDVIEHMPCPSTILQQSIRLLKAGGIVFIYVPNYDSASRILMGRDAQFIWPTHHLNYYTPRTIVDLLERHGLKVEMVTTEGLDLVDYLWRETNIKNESVAGLEKIADALQFFINAGGYGKNLRIIGRKPVARG